MSSRPIRPRRRRSRRPTSTRRSSPPPGPPVPPSPTRISPTSARIDAAVTGDTRFATLYQASEQLQTLGTSSPRPRTRRDPAVATATDRRCRLRRQPRRGRPREYLRHRRRQSYPRTRRDRIRGGRRAAVVRRSVSTVLLAIDGPTGHVKARATPGRWRFGRVRRRVSVGRSPSNARHRLRRLPPRPVARGPGGGAHRLRAELASRSSSHSTMRSGSSIRPAPMRAARAATSTGSIRRPTRRIPAPPASIATPFVSPFLGVVGRAGSSLRRRPGSIYGDPRRGFYRLATGSTSFDSLGNPNTGYHPIRPVTGCRSRPRSGRRSSRTALPRISTTAGRPPPGSSPSSASSSGPTTPMSTPARRRATTRPTASRATRSTAARRPRSRPRPACPAPRPAPSASNTRTRSCPSRSATTSLVKLWAAPSPTSPDTIALYEQSIPVP